MGKRFVCALFAVMLFLPLWEGASSVAFASERGKVAPQHGKVMASNVGKWYVKRNRARAEDERRLALGSASALVIDQTTGAALLEKQADVVAPIASISKLMMAMVTLDAGLDMEEVIYIDAEDASSPRNVRSRLPVGVSMTRDTALLLALMSSENRAANALGRNYPGGMEAFVRAMNRKARSLGLEYTRFAEPTGLSPNNVSTARDLAYLVMAAHQYPKIREYSTMASVSINMGERVLEFVNTNALVNNPQWRIGLSKTGYLSAAGRCLVMQAWVAGRPVVMVFLDSNGKMTRVGDANRIKRWMEDEAAPRGT
ncbi:MAG: D-alanyl-D-alanine endopeptidase [Zoogloeaceae bacterium]|jgi:D-alanyl-D-alanine endopeptidase (penicillin-binding protein 7)|nr:D-alanyl-D-alanine endopeptidase [Zoogloeaceae bacterium]